MARISAGHSCHCSRVRLSTRPWWLRRGWLRNAYQGKLTAEAKAGMQELTKKHDKEMLVKACDITTDFVRLKAETR